MAERKNTIYSDYAFGGNIVIANRIKESLVGTTHSRVLKPVLSGIGTLTGVLYSGDVILESHVDRDIGRNSHFTQSDCKTAIRNQSEVRQDTYSERIEGYDPPEEFQHLKGDRYWAEWLALPARKGGPTRGQLGALLEWNLGVMISENRRRHDELEVIRSDYQVNVENAVEEGRLSPQFGRQAAVRLPDIQYLVRDPLNTDLTSIAKVHSGLILLDPEYTQFTAVHETTHMHGGFKGDEWDEIATNVIARQIGDTDNTNQSAYAYMERLFRRTMIAAGVSTLELSEIYIGKDPSENSRNLHKLFLDMTGEDKLKSLKKRMRENQKFWYPRCEFDRGLTYMFSGIDLLQQDDPQMTPRDIIRREMPDMLLDDEWVGEAAEIYENTKEINVDRRSRLRAQGIVFRR
jgi:hypothetical protein